QETVFAFPRQTNLSHFLLGFCLLNQPFRERSVLRCRLNRFLEACGEAPGCPGSSQVTWSHPVMPNQLCVSIPLAGSGLYVSPEYKFHLLFVTSNRSLI